MDAISSSTVPVSSQVLPAAPPRQQDQPPVARPGTNLTPVSNPDKDYIVTISPEARAAAAQAGTVPDSVKGPADDRKTAVPEIGKKSTAAGAAVPAVVPDADKPAEMQKQELAVQEENQRRKQEERSMDEEEKLRAKQEADAAELSQAEQKAARRAEDEKQSRKGTILDAIVGDNRSSYANGVALEFDRKGIALPPDRSAPTVFSTTSSDPTKVFQQLKTRPGLTGISVFA